MTKKKCVREDMPACFGSLAEKSLVTAIMEREVTSVASPIGPDYPLVLTPALLGSLSRPADADLPVDGSSTLCGDLNGATIIGFAAEKLVRIGLAAIILEGVAKSPVVLSILHNGIAFYKADSLWGKGYHETVELLGMQHPGAAFITIGLSGEKQLPLAASGVANAADHCDEAFQSDLGTALCSKHVKALVIDDSGCPSAETADKERCPVAITAIQNEPRQPVSAVDQRIQNVSCLPFHSLLAA